MKSYLYEVRLERGRSNPKFDVFLRNASTLNAKAPGYGGINNVCIVSHRMGADDVKSIFEEGLNSNKCDLSVEEITKDSLVSLTGHHGVYMDMVEKLFCHMAHILI